MPDLRWPTFVANRFRGAGRPRPCRAYHGWRFTETGRCVEQPYETTEDPDSTFMERVTLQAYPVQELGGLIFAYLGPKPMPLLPRWDLFTWDDVAKDVGTAVIPCNWLQI